MHKSITATILLCTAALTLPVPGRSAEKVALTTTNSAAKSSSSTNDAVIAKGKGVEVKRSQLDEAVHGLKTQAEAEGKTIPPEQMQRVQSGLLEHMIQTQILLSKATDSEKAKAKEEATEQLHQAKTNAPSEEMFNARLKAMGTTPDEIVKSMAEKGTAEAVMKRELKINVTDADVKKFYDDTNNAAKFEQPETVRASHILLMTQDPKTGQELSKADKEAKHKQMEGLLKRARAGEDFGKLAKEYSEDPGSKDKGGEYTFPRGQMVPEFEAAAFSLKTNEISDIVTTQYGYHIIKLHEHIPAQKVAFDKVSPRIKDYLVQQELVKLAPDYIAKIRKDANVEILDESLRMRETPAAKAKTAS